MIKGLIHQEDITIMNIYTPNIGALKCIKELWTDLMEEIDNNTIGIGDFGRPVSTMVDHPDRNQ